MKNKQTDSIDLTKIHTICINCCGLLGDTLIRVPVIEAVANTCPQAKITVITDPGREILLKNHPDVDETIAFDRRKKPLFTYIKSLMKFVRQLRKAHYDVMINLYTGGSSSGITKFSQAKYRLGFYRNRKEKSCYTHGIAYPHYRWDSGMYHWGQQFGLLLQPFGLGVNDLHAGTTFIPTTNARQQASKYIANIKQSLVLINMGAGDIRKIWAIKKYVTLANWLQQTYNYHIGIFVNPGQEDLVRVFEQLASVEQFTKFTTFNLSDLNIIGALRQKAKFVISGDTGLLHLAIGVKTPTLAILTHTRPENVQPKDVLFMPCFIEDKNKKNAFGIALGFADLSVEYIRGKIQQLQKKLSESTLTILNGKSSPS